MDGERFDAWTRTIGAARGPRRAALRLLAGGALAGLLGASAREAAAQTAQACRERQQRCLSNRQCCPLAGGAVRCGRIGGRCNLPEKRCCAEAGGPCRRTDCDCCRDLVCSPAGLCVDITP